MTSSRKGSSTAISVGAMGWSQGGYISAYLTTHDSARFKAISVGAGNLRLDDVLRQHRHPPVHASVAESHAVGRSADLREDVPITYIKGADADVIQHGELDQRVPIPNALRALSGAAGPGCPNQTHRLQGFRPWPNKPKGQRAAMEHNLEWFDRYFFEVAHERRRGAAVSE